MSSDRIVIIDDMIFHLEDSSDLNVKRFHCLFSIHSSLQHVTGPTNHNGHPLDVIITCHVIQHNDQFICEPLSIKHTCIGDSQGILFFTDKQRYCYNDKGECGSDRKQPYKLTRNLMDIRAIYLSQSTHLLTIVLINSDSFL